MCVEQEQSQLKELWARGPIHGQAAFQPGGGSYIWAQHDYTEPDLQKWLWSTKHS